MHSLSLSLRMKQWSFQRPLLYRAQSTAAQTQVTELLSSPWVSGRGGPGIIGIVGGNHIRQQCLIVPPRSDISDAQTTETRSCDPYIDTCINISASPDYTVVLVPSFMKPNSLEHAVSTDWPL